MIEQRLSKRMRMVADFVDLGSRVVDIGCDHAFVSIYLATQNIASNIIAMDVKKGPLEIARKNIKEYDCNNIIEIRLSNGFEALNINEADTAIIAGMGGLLTVEILKNARKYTDSGITLILQPQSDIAFVRKYLRAINYYIVDEEMLIDEGKYYTIIKACCNNNNLVVASYDLDYIMDLYGPKLIIKKHNILIEYLHKEFDKNNNIILKLQNSNSQNAKTRISEIKELNRNIELCLKLMK